MKKDPSKKKTFPVGTQEDSLKDANKKLKAKIRRLESDKKKLLSEVQQCRTVFRKTEDFLKNSTAEFSLKEILDRINKEQSLHEKGGLKPKSEIKCPTCTSPIKPLIFAKFDIHICNNCGHRKRIEKENVQ